MTQRFDGAPVWRQLPDEVRAQVGPLLVEWAYAALVSASVEGDDEDECPAVRACVAGAYEVEQRLLELLTDHLPPLPEDGPPMVPVSVGSVCSTCGCTEGDACPGGCSWLSDDRCSSCKQD